MRALYLSEPSPEDLLQAHVDSLKKKEEEEAERLATYAETYEGAASKRGIGSFYFPGPNPNPNPALHRCIPGTTFVIGSQWRKDKSLRMPNLRTLNPDKPLTAPPTVPRNASKKPLSPKEKAILTQVLYLACLKNTHLRELAHRSTLLVQGRCRSINPEVYANHRDWITWLQSLPASFAAALKQATWLRLLEEEHRFVAKLFLQAKIAEGEEATEQLYAEPPEWKEWNVVVRYE